MQQYVANQDDTKLFAQRDEEDARKSLQEDLDNLHQWSEDWLLKFHPEKCCVVQLGSNNVGQLYTMKERGKDGEDNRKQLATTEAEKDH